MVNTETVIVDVQALENAISSFTQCSTAIGNNASELQTNASQIYQAMKSSASDTYQRKMRNLVKNVQSAQAELKVKIQELSNYCERSKNAEKSAQNIADSILEQGFMK